jgi:hypothetical protein
MVKLLSYNFNDFSICSMVVKLRLMPLMILASSPMVGKLFPYKFDDFSFYPMVVKHCLNWHLSFFL